MALPVLGNSPRYVEELRIGGGYASADGGVDFDKLGNIAADGDFPARVITYATEINADLFMILSLSAENTTGFTFATWNERLLFNEARIPVMSVNLADQEV